MNLSLATIKKIDVFVAKQRRVLRSLVSECDGLPGLYWRQSDAELKDKMDRWCLAIKANGLYLDVVARLPDSLGGGESPVMADDPLLVKKTAEIDLPWALLKAELMFRLQAFSLPFGTGRLSLPRDTHVHAQAKTELREFSLSEQDIQGNLARFLPQANYSDPQKLKSILANFLLFVKQCQVVDPSSDPFYEQGVENDGQISSLSMLPEAQVLKYHSEIDPYMARQVKELLFGDRNDIKVMETFAGIGVAAPFGLRDCDYLTVDIMPPSASILPGSLLESLGLAAYSSSQLELRSFFSSQPMDEKSSANAARLLRSVLPRHNYLRANIQRYALGLKPKSRVDLFFVFRWETEPAALPVLLVKPGGYFVEVSEGLFRHDPAISQLREQAGFQLETELGQRFNSSINPEGDVPVHSVAIWKNVDDRLEESRVNVESSLSSLRKP